MNELQMRKRRIIDEGIAEKGEILYSNIPKVAASPPRAHDVKLVV